MNVRDLITKLNQLNPDKEVTVIGDLPGLCTSDGGRLMFRGHVESCGVADSVVLQIELGDK